MSKSRVEVKQEKNDSSGSPQSGEPVCLTVGKLHRSHGVKGEIILEMTTEFPTRVKAGMKIYIGQKKQEFILKSIRATDKNYLVSFEGINDCETVSIFRNQWIYADESIMGVLPKGRFYQREVLGMKVFDEEGKSVGEVIEILVTGANDVYVVKTQDDKEILLPAIKPVILSMDRETRSMVVKLQEWE